MSVVDERWFRNPSKGSIFNVRTDGVAPPPHLTEAYLAGMTSIVGTTSIQGSKCTCTAMDMTELQGPTDIAAPNPPILSPDLATQIRVS